jgi:hypothetical protein
MHLVGIAHIHLLLDFKHVIADVHVVNACT